MKGRTQHKTQVPDLQTSVTTIGQQQQAKINIQSLDRLTNLTSPMSTPDID